MPVAPIPATRQDSNMKRCPACGFQYTLVYEPRCPRCKADVPIQQVTSEDATPYALAERRNRRAVREMRRWIYRAGVERLSHLALIRRSRASRSFARKHLVLLALAATLYQLSHTGWHRVIRTPDNAALITTAPGGKAWLQVASSEVSPVTYGLIALWWNPVQAGIALVVTVITGLLLAYVFLLVLNIGAGPVLSDPYRGQERLGGAIHYCTAFAGPVYYAGWIMLLVPLGDMLAAGGWRIVPPSLAISAAAAVVAGIAALMWWFWLIRLAMTLPAGARARVAAYYAVVAPLLGVGLLVGWWLGMESLFELFRSLFELGWSGG